MKAIESRTRDQVDGREQAHRQEEEQRHRHQQEIHDIQHKHNQVKEVLEQALESLNEKYAELDLKYKILVDDHA